MTSENIGEAGESLNFSVASRAMNIPADKDQMEQYDEYKAKGSPVFYIVLLLTLAVFAGTVWLFMNGHWIIGIIGILAALFLSFLSYSLATVQKGIAYESGLLIPAIIVNTNPIELIALADMSSEEGQTPLFGCRKMKVNQLPHHKIQIDEKVPCAALFGAALKGYRTHFDPRPICWGYKNAVYIKQVVDVISEDKDSLGDLKFENEWQMLLALKDKMKAITHEDVVIFDADLQEVKG
jgi:hypothetical protein